MLVSFNPSFATNNSPAFGKNDKKPSGSYFYSATKGAVGGAVIGTAVGLSLRGVAQIKAPENSKFLAKAQSMAETLSATRPLKLFAATGAAVAAVVLVFNRMMSKAKIQM